MRSVSGPSERTLVFLVGAVQFVNVLDFMMVMPLGPDFAASLGIPESQLGLIGGAYTGAAAIAGLIGATFLDRFDRRKALAVAMLGLVVATAAGGLASGLPGLIAARVLAGCFGGPATSLSLSIIADVVPPERRGKAMGAIMGAFSVASVLGVPAGLELARHGSWRTPFFAVAGLGLLVAASALFVMPPMREHLRRRAEAAAGPAAPAVALLRNPAALLALTANATVMVSVFVVVPNLATYLQHNAGYPRADLGLLYMVGGMVSFFTMRLVGAWVDRAGAGLIAGAGSLFYMTVMVVGFTIEPMPVPVLAIFVALMVSSSFRAVPLNTLSTRVPLPHERARFMSLQSAVQHVAAAAGALLSTRMLSTRASGALDGMASVAFLSIALAPILPVLLYLVEGHLRRRPDAARAAPPAVATIEPADGVP